ncbi:MAG: hypothetical protein KAI64_07280 [Thermoplasmata archaeon]|nr:hypothetical protein [Thermoplasmata archaeon]
MGKKKPTIFNIIKKRGSPTEATTAAGDKVKKEPFLIVPSPHNPDTLVTIQCADYHEEHFVYLDPLFFIDLKPDDPRKIWWAMCTCGSPAVVVGGTTAAKHEGHNWIHEVLNRDGHNVENILVCEHYMARLDTQGHGWHQGQEGRQWR